MFEIFKIDENLDLDNVHQKAIEDLEVINYKYRGE